MRAHLAVVLVATLGCGSEPGVTGGAGGGGAGGAAGSGGGAGAPISERLYVGTGEYQGQMNWHGVLRFEDAQGIDADATGPVAPSGTVPVKQTVDAAGVALNFAHGIYVWEARDEIFLSTLFTRADGVACGPCDPMDPSQPGSIAVLSSASGLDGPQVVARHLFGGDAPLSDQTKLTQPHGVWVDEARDLLYVANTFGKSVLVFEPASSVSGNVPPARSITTPELGAPVFVFHEPVEDRLFVASMASMPQAPAPSIQIYAGASALDGKPLPDVRIMGPSTRLQVGNQTTHDVWFDATRRLLVVGHHTNELLFFDLSGVDLDPPMPVVLDLAPRVVDVSTSDADAPGWSVYGLFWLPDVDRLYVSTGFAQMGPKPGSPPNVVRVFEGLADPSASGRVPPVRTIAWTNGDVYFPPQPLWVTRRSAPGTR